MANMADLILLRNDPAVAVEFLQAAIKGDVDAQYGMGLIYAEGRGVEQDEARAIYWLTRAIGQGDKGAAVLRQIVAANMTPEQLTEADSLINTLDISPGSAIRRNRAERKTKPSRTVRH